MKCPKCRSHMYVADETQTDKSHVTFFRCTLCVSEHVSSEPIAMSPVERISERAGSFAEPVAAGVQYAL